MRSQSHSSADSSRHSNLAEGCASSSYASMVSKSRTGEIKSTQEMSKLEKDEYDTDLEIDDDFGSGLSVQVKTLVTALVLSGLLLITRLILDCLHNKSYLLVEL